MHYTQVYSTVHIFIAEVYTIYMVRYTMELMKMCETLSVHGKVLKSAVHMFMTGLYTMCMVVYTLVRLCETECTLKSVGLYTMDMVMYTMVLMKICECGLYTSVQYCAHVHSRSVHNVHDTVHDSAIIIVYSALHVLYVTAHT